MKFCTNCGQKIKDGLSFCPHCGKQLHSQKEKRNFDQSTNQQNSRTEYQRKQKKSRWRIKLLLWLLACIVMTMGTICALLYFEIADIPVVEEVIHEIEIILHKEHVWIDSTCVDPKMCEICDETEGDPLGHSWIPATCIDAEICSVCGEIGKSATGHDWIDASCTNPKTCSVCKKTDGIAAGHIWIEATYEEPKTCQVCGETEGEPLKPDPVYLVDMEFSDKYGKIWTWSEYVLDYYTHSNPDDSNAYMDMNTPGHTAGKVYDHLGNRYTNGLCVDLGGPASTYYVSYDLDGIYTTFTGVCSLIEGMKGTSYTKYFEIYCDGKLVFTSNTMTKGSSAQPFSIDVTGVQVLRIQYPPTKGQNRIATLFDGKLN